jgi:hydroxymethylbilane synthase
MSTNARLRDAGRLVIGTRGSQLALWQTRSVASRLESIVPGLHIEVRTIKTTGDKVLDSPLSKIGDKGLFTKEIEQQLLAGTIDLAVHSLKDIPTQLPAGLVIGAITEREDVRDVFLAHPRKKPASLETLPYGARIATGSLRRTCQLLAYRPDFTIVNIRGNLNTRLEKLDNSDWDGMILALAGVRRLGWESRIDEVLPLEMMLPAVGQGALAVEIRESDTQLAEALKALHHEPTAVAVYAERALLRCLEGGCQVPIGTYGRLEHGKLRLNAMIGSLDGKRIVRGEITGETTHAEDLGIRLANDLLENGGREILEEIRRAGNISLVPDA